MHSFVRRPFRYALPVIWVCSSLVGSVPSTTANGSDDEADSYRQEIDSWHKKRLQSLKNPDGYLSLAGLFSLVEGTNRFGSAADNDMVFPDGTPPRAGAFIVTDGAVRVEVAQGVQITENDAPVKSAELKSDSEGGPTVLAMGTLRFYVIDRSGSLYVRLKDHNSEALKHFEGIDRFPVEPEWRVEARFEPYDPPKIILVPNVLGGEFEELCPGRVLFEVAGEACILEPMSASDGRLFFVFGDGTSGLETYGGGRFLKADPPSDDGIVVLDFNKSYNPPCAFTPFATCPLPHTANLLTVRVEAGEKSWGKGH